MRATGSSETPRFDSSVRWPPDCRTPRRSASTPRPGRRDGPRPSRPSRRSCTAATTRSGTTATRPGARPPPRRWCSASGALARPRLTPRGSTLPSPADGPRRTQRLRLPLRRGRPLTVQRRLRSRVRSRGLRHAASVAYRGRGVHKGRHPAGGVRVAQGRQARRRRVLHQGPPARDPRLPPLRRRHRELTLLPPHRRRHPGARHLRPRAVREHLGPPLGRHRLRDPPDGARVALTAAAGQLVVPPGWRIR